MSNKRKNKEDQLGMPFGTACGRLRKLILFELVRDVGKDTCFRCGDQIQSIDEFSIDHKTPWLHSESPKTAFFDLKNVTFSHLSCNSSAARPSGNKGEQHGGSKLNKDAVNRIRKSSLPTRELAKQFGVHVTHIRRLRRGIGWQ